ncbi:hypothetical protein [Pseudonocardia broussonetiae]|uniref:Uncharacterized protein n=1 Tax=Pseudonocardia broussonetiae TaxID=2736640 RepID=A0A6M6JCN4_9PSEU|nr:hypothetical protein [Pseudonocardia broussonetiae]QJY45718.1 hypothetical protein HOP40_07825 [Pseudonocardia broussonetiae]
MLATLARVVAIAALTGGAVLVGAGSASAAHCTGTTAEDMSSPGFSYFGTDHVKEAEHAEGGNPGPHGGTSGASNCRDTTGSPAERAPGQNR